jgi:hypothetical protein
VYQGISLLPENGLFLMFAGKKVDDRLANSLNDEIIQCKWFTKEELDQLKDEDLLHPIMRNVIKNALKPPYPLDIFTDF